MCIELWGDYDSNLLPWLEMRIYGTWRRRKGNSEKLLRLEILERFLRLLFFFSVKASKMTFPNKYINLFLLIVDAEGENTCLEIGGVFFCYVLLPSSGENPDRVMVAILTKKYKLRMC